MLAQFRVKNYASFREEACLDMRAVKAYKEHPYNLYPLPNGESLLKVAAIYGANASGKSNLMKAYSAFCSLVRESFNNAQDRKSVLEVYYNPFLLSPEGQDTDTEYSAVYIRDEYQYEYGFVHNADEVVAEWLYRTKTVSGARKSTIFERDHINVHFGRAAEKSCTKYKDEIKKDVLVLSFFNRLKLKITAFSAVYEAIVFLPPFVSFSQKFFKGVLEVFFKGMAEEEKKDLLRFFHEAGIYINDFSVDSSKEGTQIRFFHPGADGKSYSLPSNLESEGTVKAIVLYLYAKMVMNRGSVLLVDELNMQLHPLLTRYLVNMFHANGGGGQLIYTTHDTTLMDKSFFRRDEVWFVERSPTCESTLYSLSDFKIRKDASFEKEYLGGAYGGIPILQDADACGGE